MANPNITTVRARRQEIAKLRQSIDEEDKELEVTERTLMRLASSKPAPQPMVDEVKPTPRGPISQADLVISTLEGTSKPWLDSPAALHAEIKRLHGVDIKKSSFQPVISQLKAKKIIVRDGTKIALASRVPPQPDAPNSGSPKEGGANVWS
jgi:hypothetical protein